MSQQKEFEKHGSKDPENLIIFHNLETNKTFKNNHQLSHKDKIPQTFNKSWKTSLNFPIDDNTKNFSKKDPLPITNPNKEHWTEIV